MSLWTSHNCLRLLVKPVKKLQLDQVNSLPCLGQYHTTLAYDCLLGSRRVLKNDQTFCKLEQDFLPPCSVWIPRVVVRLVLAGLGVKGEGCSKELKYHQEDVSSHRHLGLIKFDLIDLLSVSFHIDLHCEIFLLKHGSALSQLLGNLMMVMLLKV